MAGDTSRLEAELRRLGDAPHQNEKPIGVGTIRFVARCPLGAGDVLERVISVLRTIDEVALEGWPTDEQWATKLPEWFTSACASSMTPDEAERWLAWWRGLPPDEQERSEREKDWSLDSWLYWMEPCNRQWYWWDAEVLDDCDHILVAVEVEAWPFPWGALRWLFKTAGASALEPEE
jgi:hypothetical protein